MKRPATISVPLKPFARRSHRPEAWSVDLKSGNVQQVRCEIMASLPDASGDKEEAIIYLQRVEGCGYEVIELELDEAEQIGRALIKMVADVKAYRR